LQSPSRHTLRGSPSGVWQYDVTLPPSVQASPGACRLRQKFSTQSALILVGTLTPSQELSGSTPQGAPVAIRVSQVFSTQPVPPEQKVVSTSLQSPPAARNTKHCLRREHCAFGSAQTSSIVHVFPVAIIFLHFSSLHMVSPPQPSVLSYRLQPSPSSSEPRQYDPMHWV
jgi:hypothetical protein